MNFPATADAGVARKKPVNEQKKNAKTHWNTHMMTIDYGK